MTASKNIGWIHGLGSGTFPAASYGILPSRTFFVFSPFKANREAMYSGLRTPADNCLSNRTYGQLPPRDTSHGVKTVALGWVGAPTEITLYIQISWRSRWFSRSMSSVKISESRRFAPNNRPEFISSRCGPNNGLNFVFLGFLQKFGMLFFSKRTSCP